MPVLRLLVATSWNDDKISVYVVDFIISGVVGWIVEFMVVRMLRRLLPVTND